LNKSLLSLAALLAATALIAAGCGSSDDSSDSDEPAPTKAAYVTEADAICAADSEKITNLSANLPTDLNDPVVTDAITNEILPIYREQLTKLRELTPPEGEEETTAAIYDALETGLDQVEEDPQALGERKTFADANEKASAFGLVDCSS